MLSEPQQGSITPTKIWKSLIYTIDFAKRGRNAVNNIIRGEISTETRRLDLVSGMLDINDRLFI